MLKKFAVICTLMLCVLVAGCSDDQTATVIPQPETKQTQNNKNQEITVTVYRAPVAGKGNPQIRRDDCSGDSVGYFGKQQSAGYCENGQSVS